jgi:hypothetical protein
MTSIPYTTCRNPTKPQKVQTRVLHTIIRTYQRQSNTTSRQSHAAACACVASIHAWSDRQGSYARSNRQAAGACAKQQR